MNKFPNVKIETINNLKVLWVPLKTNTVSISFIIKAGGFEETKSETGVAHFLEHLFATNLRESEIQKTAINKGSRILSNAYTSNFFTSYYINTLSKNQKVGLELILDTFLLRDINLKILERERNSIIVEMNKKCGSKDDLLWNVVLPKLMLGDNRIIRNPFEHVKNVYNITPNKLSKFMEKYYTLDNSILVISGEYDYKKLYKMLKATDFKKIPKKNTKITRKIKMHNKKFNYYFLKDAKQIYKLIFSFRTFSSDSKNKYVLKFLSTIMDNIGSSSILFNRLRTKAGITYSPMTKIYNNKYYGIYTIIFNTTFENIGRGIDEMVKIFKDLKNKKIEEKYIKLAISQLNYYIVNLKNTMKSSMFLDYGTHVLNDSKIETPDVVFKQYYKNMTSDKIMKISKQIFNGNNLTFVVIGSKDIDTKLYTPLKQL